MKESEKKARRLTIDSFIVATAFRVVHEMGDTLSAEQKVTAMGAIYESLLEQDPKDIEDLIIRITKSAVETGVILTRTVVAETGMQDIFFNLLLTARKDRLNYSGAFLRALKKQGVTTDVHSIKLVKLLEDKYIGAISLGINIQQELL